MGQLSLDAAERAVLELKRPLLESDVALDDATLERLVLHGVVTGETATQIRVSERFRLQTGELRRAFVWIHRGPKPELVPNPRTPRTDFSFLFLFFSWVLFSGSGSLLWFASDTWFPLTCAGSQTPS